jgi:hypothetical protein
MVHKSGHAAGTLEAAGLWQSDMKRGHGQAFKLGEQAGSYLGPAVGFKPDNSWRLAIELDRAGRLKFEE